MGGNGFARRINELVFVSQLWGIRDIWILPAFRSSFPNNSPRLVYERTCFGGRFVVRNHYHPHANPMRIKRQSATDTKPIQYQLAADPLPTRYHPHTNPTTAQYTKYHPNTSPI